MRRATFAAKLILPLLCLVLFGCTEDVPDPLTEAAVLGMLKEKSGITVVNVNDDGNGNGNGDGISLPVSSGMIAFISEDDDGSQIYLMNSDGTGKQLLDSNWLDMDSYPPFWSPDGKVAFWSIMDSAINVVKTDGTQHSQISISNVGPMFDPDYHFSWSSNGQIAFSHDSADFTSSDVYVVNADGTGLMQVTVSFMSFSYYPTWSPDGTQIAYIYEDAVNGNFIRVLDSFGNVRQITFAGTDWEPAWSPKGDKIAFSSERDGNSEIYSINADGTNLINLTNRPYTEDFTPTWSPDGTQIAFVSDDEDGYYDIYVMDSDGRNQMNITNTPGADEYAPAWSP